MVHALELPVLVCDAVGRLVLANPAVRDLLEPAGEREADEVGQRSCWVAEEGLRVPPSLATVLERALETREPASESLSSPLGGRRGLSQVSARVLWSPCGELLGAMVTVTPADCESAGEDRLRTYAADMELLGEVSGVLAELQDPDEAASVICTVATGATGAIAVLLWELAGDELVTCCSEGAVRSEILPEIVNGVRNGARRAVSEAHSVVERLGDLHSSQGSPANNGAWNAPGTAWHEPLRTNGPPTGALTIVWAGELDDVDRPGLLIRSLADHAATALERAGLLRRLKEAAHTDPLTGLPNRRVWEEGFARELARARRETRPLTLALIDIDHFKAYNDCYGHPEGDRLLQLAARAWSAQLRATDLLARIGGEEFAVLLPGCPTDSARLVADRLRVAMPDGETCSLGTVTWDGLATAEELYATVDAALYAAKRNGRNRVQIGCLGRAFAQD